MKKYILQLIFVSITIMAISGCSPARDVYMDVWEAPEVAVADVQASEEVGIFGIFREVNEPQGIGDLSLLMPDDLLERQLIYTTMLDLETFEFMQGLRIMLHIVSDMNGYTEQAVIRGRSLTEPASAMRVADYLFRIPVERLQDFIFELEENFNILSLSITSRDVTTVNRRLDDGSLSLQEQESRLLTYLEDEQDTELRLELERELAHIRNRILDQQAELANHNFDILMTRVHVALIEADPLRVFVAVEPLTISEQIALGLNNSVQWIISVIVWLSSNIINIMIIAVVGFTVWMVYKKSETKNKKKAE